jgi:integrase
MVWDKGLDYESTYNKIARHMVKVKVPGKCYDAVLLIQLRNGSRISEAVRAFKQFLAAKSLELEVPVSKKRGKRETRLMIIPQELRSLTSPCRDLKDVDEKVLVNRVKFYCVHTYGFNTHSLRYAFITFLLRQGVNPSIIAKITKHSRLDFILTYTQEKAAEEILKELG